MAQEYLRPQPDSTMIVGKISSDYTGPLPTSQGRPIVVGRSGMENTGYMPLVVLDVNTSGVGDPFMAFTFDSKTTIEELASRRKTSPDMARKYIASSLRFIWRNLSVPVQKKILSGEGFAKFNLFAERILATGEVRYQEDCIDRLNSDSIIESDQCPSQKQLKKLKLLVDNAMGLTALDEEAIEELKNDMLIATWFVSKAGKSDTVSVIRVIDAKGMEEELLCQGGSFTGIEISNGDQVKKHYKMSIGEEEIKIDKHILILPDGEKTETLTDVFGKIERGELTEEERVMHEESIDRAKKAIEQERALGLSDVNAAEVGELINLFQTFRPPAKRTEINIAPPDSQ
jgi:hypothetical protein